MKRNKRSIALIVNLSLLVFFFAAIYTALNASWVHDIYFRMIENKTGWKIQTEKIRINPFLGRVKVQGIQIESKTGRQKILVDGAYVRVSPLSLVRGKIIVRQLDVRNADMTFMKNRAKKAKGPKKFTLENIKRIARKVAGNFALQNISVDSGHLGPVSIKIEKKSGKLATLDIGNFQFDLHQTLLRKNEFNFEVHDFSINEKVVADRLHVKSVLGGNRVIFNYFQYERPEGKYHLVLDAQGKGDHIAGDLKIKAHISKAFKDEIHGVGKVVLKPPMLYINDLELEMGAIDLKASGQLDILKKLYDVKLDMAAEPLEEVTASLPFSVLEPLSGSVQIQAQMKAKLPELKVHAEVQAKPIQYDNVQFSEFEATADMNGRHITWDAALPRFNAAKVRSTGAVDIEGKPKKFVLKELGFKFNNIQLESIVAEQKAAGLLKGEVDFKSGSKGLAGSGNLELAKGRIGQLGIEAAKARFSLAGKQMTVDKLHLELSDKVPLNFTRPVQVKLGEERITISGDPAPGISLAAHYDKKPKVWTLDKFRLQEGGQVFNVSGLYRSDKTFQLKAQGGLDAKYLTNLRTLVNDASGVVDVNIQASGSTDRPQLTGNIAFKGASIDMRRLGDTIQDLSGSIQVRPSLISFNNIHGIHGDGEFRIDGTVGVDGVTPKSFNLKLKGDSLTYRLRGAMQVDFDADVTVKGAMPSPFVSGRVDLLAGRYYKNFNITKKVLGGEIPTAKEGETFELLKEWRWDVAIRNSGELKIENNIANVYLDGNLKLKGTTQRPVLEGVVTSSGGELYYLGKDLQITEGSLEFQDPNKINPILTFKAQKEVAAAEGRGLQSFYTVYIELEGPLDNIKTTLSSAPPVDQSDIVSLLAFGMTRSELQDRGNSGRAFAATALASSLTSGYGEDLGEKFGLNILRFEAAEGSEQAISGVAVGRNFADRLTVEFYTDITPDSAQRRVRSKYFLTDNIFLEGSNTIEDERTEFELNVSLRFKIR